MRNLTNNTRTSIDTLLRRSKIKKQASCSECGKLAWNCKCKRTALDLSNWIIEIGEDLLAWVRDEDNL